MAQENSLAIIFNIYYFREEVMFSRSRITIIYDFPDALWKGADGGQLYLIPQTTPATNRRNLVCILKIKRP